MEKRVSVIVPVYNVEKYLRKCVRSLILQTYRNIEIILVDDGSTDSSGKICDELAGEDDRIRVIHKSNGGLSDARNAGFEHVSGSFVTYVDSDDYVSERYVEKLVLPFENENIDVSVCKSLPFTIDPDGEEHFSSASSITGYCIFPADQALEIMLRQSLFDTEAWSKMYRTELMAGFSFPKGLYNEDLASIYKLFLRSRSVSYCGERLYFYLQRNDSIMGNKRNVKRFWDSYSIAECLQEDIIEKRPGLARAAKSRALSVYFQSFAGATHCEDAELAEKCWERVKKLRFGVLFDPKGRPKARAAAILSLGGKRMFMTAYDGIIKK
jgi:glycosyltransferase involved in cell wall biosynthesis